MQIRWFNRETCDRYKMSPRLLDVNSSNAPVDRTKWQRKINFRPRRICYTSNAIRDAYRPQIARGVNILKLLDEFSRCLRLCQVDVVQFVLCETTKPRRMTLRRDARWGGVRIDFQSNAELQIVNPKIVIKVGYDRSSRTTLLKVEMFVKTYTIQRSIICLTMLKRRNQCNSWK